MIPPLLLEKAKAKGNQEAFEAYVRQFPCAFTGIYHAVVDGEGRSIFAHYNPVNRGGGTGVKVDYSGLPTLEEIHSVFLHKRGENPNVREFLETETIKYLTWFVNDRKPLDFETYKAKRGRTYETDNKDLGYAIFMGRCRAWQGDKKQLVRIHVEMARKKRTVKQNKSHWFIYQQMEKAIEKDPIILGAIAGDFAEMLVKRVLASKDVTDQLHTMLKEILLEGKSTTTLDIETWGSEYAHELIHYNRERLGVEDIEMPVNNEGY